MAENRRIDCPDCLDEMTRREFTKAIGGAAVVVGGLLPTIGGRIAAAAEAGQGPSPTSAAETAAGRLFKSLSDEQREILCFPFDHNLRRRISANWAITEPTIGDLNTEQQKLVEEIFQGVPSPDGYERFLKQMDDDSGGFPEYHIAMFGEPGSSDGFEFTMTGRHLTARADGNSTPGAAFGGPIIYGHGAGNGQAGLPGNVFYYQTQQANEVFKALDGKQREKALVSKAPPEARVPVQGESGSFPGIDVSELSSDQKELVEKVIRIILAPYREEDVDEAMAILKDGGGLDALHMAFYEEQDLGSDQEWDLWRLEGPTFVWHFRGAPHVHAYVNIAKKA
ncbi:DUF3500 domain-containing protein [soil metagenome]